MSKITGATPVVADERRHTWARVIANGFGNAVARGRSQLMEGAKHRGVGRNRAEQVVLEPEVFDVGVSSLPPPASINAVWTKTDLAPVVQRGSFPTGGGSSTTANHPAPIGRQMCQERAGQRGPPHLLHRVPTTTRFALVAFTLEVPFWSGSLLRRHQQFPLLGGLFRGRGTFSSRDFVNTPGLVP